MSSNYTTITCNADELKQFLDLTFFDPCDPIWPRRIFSSDNFCSQSPKGSCDQVWLKSDLSFLSWNNCKKEEEEEERRKKSEETNKLRGNHVT